MLQHLLDNFVQYYKVTEKKKVKPLLRIFGSGAVEKVIIWLKWMDEAEMQKA